MKPHPRRGLVLLLIGGSIVANVDSVAAAERSLSDMSLEELMNEPVTSVAKKVTRLGESAAAIAVITQDDIRRMGVTTLAEALRLAPGLDVARITANAWAISSRGFNHQFARTVLVLVDGRSVYSPNSGGVYWNSQDTLLEDVDRIEVIRGPGATLWGANAVNGVINIITKQAAQTQGALASAVVGTEDRPTVGVRYGGAIGDAAHYRVYAKYYDRDGFDFENGADGDDDWRGVRTGFRTDWSAGREAHDSYTLQGDFYDTEASVQADSATLTPPGTLAGSTRQANRGGNVLARWTRDFSATSALTLQVFAEKFRQGNGSIDGTNFNEVFDFDMQHRFSLGTHDVVWGGGFRYSHIDVESHVLTFWNPNHFQISLFNAFVQDEIRLAPDLSVTVGSKFEHNSLDRWQVQPNVRMLWMPTERQTVWSAVSRATRTPSLFELAARSELAAFDAGPGNLPGLVVLLSNWTLRAEELTAFELGYRITPTPRVSIDIAAFVNDYDEQVQPEPLPTTVETQPAPPHLRVGLMQTNDGSGRTHGLEVATQWQVAEHWKLTGSYTWLHMKLTPDAATERDSPQSQLQLRSYLDVSRDVGLSAAAYYVDSVAPQQRNGRARVPSYVRLDAGVIWRLGPSVQLGLWGQNLLDDAHPEFGNIPKSVLTEVPRSVVAKLTWTP